MREYLLDRRGTCALFFHVPATGGNGAGSGNGAKGGAPATAGAAPEIVVQATSQIRVAGTEEVLAGLRAYPQVADVWTE
jgi:hypothetical protein